MQGLEIAHHQQQISLNMFDIFKTLAGRTHTHSLRKAPFPTGDLLTSNVDEGLEVFAKYGKTSRERAKKEVMYLSDLRPTVWSLTKSVA